MAERKAFLLRVEPALLEAVQRWANDDLRSLNGQIEFVLREALRRAGRQKGARSAGTQGAVPADSEETPAGGSEDAASGHGAEETAGPVGTTDGREPAGVDASTTETRDRDEGGHPQG